MAQPPVKPPKKVRVPATATAGLRDATATGGQDILSKAVQRSADDVARLEETLKKSARKLTTRKNASLEAESGSEAGLTRSEAEADDAAASIAFGSDAIAGAPTPDAARDAMAVPPAQADEAAALSPAHVGVASAPAGEAPPRATPHAEPEKGVLHARSEAVAPAAVAEPESMVGNASQPASDAGRSFDAPEAAEDRSHPHGGTSGADRSASAESPAEPLRAAGCGAFGFPNLDALADGLTALNRLALDALHTNARLTLDFCTSLANVRSLTDALNLQATLARESFEAFNEQARGIRTAAQAIARSGQRERG